MDTILASGETTPGSGSLPMSVLFAKLPRELKFHILDRAVPRDLEMQFSYRTLGVPSGRATAPLQMYDRVPLEGEWETLSTLTRVSAYIREQTLQILREATCVRASNDNKLFMTPGCSIYRDWISRCQNVVLKSERYTTFHVPTRDQRLEHSFPSQLHTTLRSTLSVVISRRDQPVRLPSFEWHISIRDHSESELRGLLQHMRTAEADMQSQYASDNATQYLIYLPDEEVADKECLLSSHMARSVSPEPAWLSLLVGGIHQSDWSEGTWECYEGPWQGIDVPGMERLIEHLGRRAMLDVLGVFLPYFQPETEGTENVDGALRIVTLARGS